MARALAHKKTAGQKTRKVVRPVQKPKPKKAAQSSSRKAVKTKELTRKSKSRDVAAAGKVASPAKPKHIHKESMTMEVESGKAASTTAAPSAFDAAPHLLRHTKTTTAALALLEKGIELIFKKEFKKARTELKSLVESYPGELDILARARSYIQICDREEAAQKKQSISTDQLYALGVMEHNKGNYDTAIAHFLQSLEKHPGADYIYYSVAASQALKGDAAAALENLRKAVELNEDSRIYAKNDSDFSALQTRKEFAELVGIAPVPGTEPQ